MPKKNTIFFLLCLLSLTVLLFSCNEPSSTATPKHVHVFGEWQTVTEPTCSSEGLMKRTCAECGGQEEHQLQTTAHTLTAAISEPTCTEQGYTVYLCKCGYSYTSDYVSPLGHKLSKEVTLPTCGEQGYTHFDCEVCEYEFKSNFTKPLGHTLSQDITPPTCTEQGYTHYSCESCEYEFNADFTEPLGHSYTKQKIYPTATKLGHTTYTCECSHSYTVDISYADILTSVEADALYKGIDVSKWNHTKRGDEFLPLDWNAIKAAGFDFVIIKMGGLNGLEPTFEMDYAGAKAAGLQVGAYIYTYSTSAEGALKDAENALEWIKGKQFEFPIYFDLEDTSQKALGKDLLSEMCITFIEKLQENGYYAALYTNHDWLTNVLDTERILELFDIWYARYSGTTEPDWDEEKYGKPLGMWQYTQSGSIEGFNCNFDMNYAYKDYAELMKKWELNGF